jgi:hypothetical protein
VTGAVSSLKDVSVDIVQVQTGKVFAVVAKLSAPPKESEHGTITIDTTATSQPKLVVPVTINVLKR